MWKKRYFLLAALNLTLIVSMFAQPEYRVYGVQGGLSIASQRWESFSQQALFTPHFDFTYENYKPGRGRSFYSSLGYHVRGFTQRFRGVSFNTGDVIDRRYRNKHKNLVANIGMKGRSVKDSGNAIWYVLAFRGEYNLANDFEIFQALEDDINPVVAGVTLSFGYEWLLHSKGMAIFIVSIQPDFTNQIYLRPQSFVDLNGNQVTLKEERIRNFTIELGVGYSIFRDRY